MKFALTLPLMLALASCATTITKVEVAHSPLPAAAIDPKGPVFVAPLADTRTKTYGRQIGQKRMGIGIPMGAVETRSGRPVA
ncbi:MAG: hypothetical protein AAF514_03830, partial [Verrucomicrobiota bacterium]